MITAALSLAAQGLAVFPCGINKRPATPHGFKDATRDPDAVRAMFSRRPGPLIGIATGAPSDLAVLDIDTAGGLDWWAEHAAALPATLTIRTRSGGLHLWFKHADGLRCSASQIAPGVDVRADGGYVIAWHAAGLPVLRSGPLANWPASAVFRPIPKAPPRVPELPRVPDNRQLSALVRFVAGAPIKQRNSRLFWASCRMAAMVASRYLSESFALELLTAAALQAGLPENEARKTAQSGLATGHPV